MQMIQTDRLVSDACWPGATTRNLYRIHGLTLAADMELPELAPAAPGSTVDAVVELGDVEFRLPHVRAEGPWWMAGDAQFQLDIADVARYRVSHGDHILVQAMPGAAPGDVRLYLLGTVLGALLHQRGLLALHAGAIEVEGRAMAFAGHSGSGKSTLVAHLRERGHRLISDDLLAVSVDDQGHPWAQPSFARIKLWADALQHLPRRQEPLVRCHTRLQKYHLTAADDYREYPLPLGSVYLLAENHEDDTVRLEPLSGLNAVNALARETYKPRHLAAMGLQQAHFRLCSQIARHTRVAVLRRPKMLRHMGDVLDHLESAWSSYR